MLVRISNNYNSKTISQLILTTIVSIMVAACSGPNTKSIAQLGKMAKVPAIVISDAKSLQDEFNFENAVTRNACRYLSNRRYNLADKPDPLVNDSINGRALLTSALLKYIEALVLADDPQGVAKVRSAAATFSDTLAKTLAVPGSPGFSIVAGPVIGFLVNGIVQIDELNRRKEILAIATEVDNVLFSAGQNFHNDQEEVTNFLIQRLKQWEWNVRCVLKHTRHHQDGAYELFLRFNQAKAAYVARIKLINRSAQLYKTITDAHHAMVESPTEFNDAIANMQSTIDELTKLVKALQNV